MAETQNQEVLTTAQAAKLLGVRADTVHVMKTEGHLTVVGKGPHSTNLFARADVERLRLLRLKAQRVVTSQTQLPDEDELECDGCRALRAQVLAAEDRVTLAEERARVAEGRAERAMAMMNAAMNAAVG